MKISEIAEYVANNYPDFCTSQSCKVIKGCREEWYEENLIEPLLNFYIHEKMDLCECGRPEDTYEVIRSIFILENRGAKKACLTMKL